MEENPKKKKKNILFFSELGKRNGGEVLLLIGGRGEGKYTCRRDSVIEGNLVLLSQAGWGLRRQTSQRKKDT